MGGIRSIAVFKESNLELVGHYPTAKAASEELLGAANKSTGISKYLKGKRQNFHDMIWVYVDLSKGNEAVDVEALRETARSRRDDPDFFKNEEENIQTEFKIEKGFAIPRVRHGIQYPFADMEVGDSFDAGVYEKKLKNRVYGAIKTYERDSPKEDKSRYIVRKLEDRIRVWRKE